jgi:hypothetical protein
MRQGRRDEAVVAEELPVDAAGPILQAGLAPALRMKVFGPMVGGWYGITADSSSADYLTAARTHVDFELRARG